MTDTPAKFEVAMSNGLREDGSRLRLKDQMKAAQYPLHHVTYTCAKFEFDMSNGLGEDAFTRKYII